MLGPQGGLLLLLVAGWRFPDDEDWTWPRELHVPNQQEVVEIYAPFPVYPSFSPTQCQGIGVEKGIRKKNPVK